MIETSSTGAVMMTGQHIPLFRLMTLRNGLTMEVVGMRMSRGRSCYAIAKAEFGFKGNKANVLEQLDAYVESEKVRVNAEEAAR